MFDDSVLAWLPVITEISVIASGAIIYACVRHARGRLRKVRYAEMLLAELEILRIRIAPYYPIVGEIEEIIRGTNEVENSTMILPHAAYDGLMSSGNISFFDRKIQQRLHRFYWMVIEHNRPYVTKPAIQTTNLFGGLNEDGGEVSIKDSLLPLIWAVEMFRDDHMVGERWMRVLKALRLVFDD